MSAILCHCPSGFAKIEEHYANEEREKQEPSVTCKFFLCQCKGSNVLVGVVAR